MTRIVAVDQEDRILLPDETLLMLTTTEVKVVEREGKNGPYSRLEFKFTIADVIAAGDGGPREKYLGVIGSPIWGGVSARLTTAADNPLRLWAEALLNIQITAGFELDTDYLVNRRCRGVVQQYTTRKVDGQGNPLKGNSVGHVLGIGHSTQPVTMPVAPPVMDAWGGTKPPF
jgi:hypothetical protein